VVEFQRLAHPPFVNTDGEGLADALETLITDPRLRRELGEEGRRWAMEYHSPRRVVDRLMEVYRSLS